MVVGVTGPESYLASAFLDTQEHRERAAEIKFLLPAERATPVIGWARANLTADPHGGGDAGDVYRTSTLYFDTTDFDVFHRRGSYGRTKYRVRRYGTSDVVFLERKMRTRRLLSKRRSIVDVNDLVRFDPDRTDDRSEVWTGAWFARRLATRQFRPVCEIRYERVARVLATPYGLARFTVDRHIGAAAIDTPRFTTESGVVVAPGQAVIELKYRFVMPALFKAAVEEFKIAPGRLSKYRLAVSALGLAQEAECSSS